MKHFIKRIFKHRSPEQGYITQQSRLQAYGLVAGRKPHSGELLSLSACGTYSKLRQHLEDKRRNISDRSKKLLESKKATSSDVITAYWLYLGRYPESIKAIYSRLRVSQTKWNLVESIKNSESHKKHLERLKVLDFPSKREEPKFVYIHIPKCAGTSFDDYCRKSFGEHVHFDRIGFSYNRDSVAGKIIIGGHRDITIYDALKEKPVIISVVRNPLDRAISLYNYYAKQYRENGYEGNGFDPESAINTMLLSSGSNQYCNNAQCRFLSGSDSFKDTLACFKNYRYVITTIENLNQFSAYLHENFGFSKNRIPEANVTPKPNDIETEHPGIKELLYSLNEEDMKLYNHIRSHKVLDTLRLKSSI